MNKMYIIQIEYSDFRFNSIKIIFDMGVRPGNEDHGGTTMVAATV